MSPKIRYSLIGVGFAVFLILSPIILFYVQGKKISLNERRSLNSGIITVETEPNSSEVFLNGEKMGTSPKDMRFLTPGEYQLDIRKDGYRNWSKRLAVFPDRVTWANMGVEKLFLFKDDSPPLNIDKGVNSFTYVNGSIYYTTDTALVKASGKNYEIKEYLSLPKDTYDFRLSDNKEFFLLIGQTKIIKYTLNDKVLDDISSKVFGSDSLTVSNNGLVYSLEKNKLFSLDGSNKKLVMSNILGYELFGNDIYAINTDGKFSKLIFINRSENVAQQELLTNLNIFVKPRIIVTPGKTVYIVDSNILYRVGTSLERIANGIINVKQSDDSEVIAYTTAGELQTFDGGTGKIELVNRSVLGYKDVALKNKIGYAFTVSGNEIKAIELDNRDRPNSYTFGKLTDPKAFYVDNSDEKMFILDGDELKFTIIH